MISCHLCIVFLLSLCKAVYTAYVCDPGTCTAPQQGENDIYWLTLPASFPEGTIINNDENCTSQKDKLPIRGVLNSATCKCSTSGCVWTSKGQTVKLTDSRFAKCIKPATCKDNPVIANAESVQCEGTIYANACTRITCKPGYVRANEVMCGGPAPDTASWQQQTNVCVKTNCTQPPTISNSKTTRLFCDWIDTTNTVSHGWPCPFECVDGYRPIQELTCVGDRLWSSSVVCEQYCLGVSVEKAGRNPECTTSKGMPGDTCQVGCPAGYQAPRWPCINADSCSKSSSTQHPQWDVQLNSPPVCYKPCTVENTLGGTLLWSPLGGTPGEIHCSEPTDMVAYNYTYSGPTTRKGWWHGWQCDVRCPYGWERIGSVGPYCYNGVWVPYSRWGEHLGYTTCRKIDPPETSIQCPSIDRTNIWLSNGQKWNGNGAYLWGYDDCGGKSDHVYEDGFAFVARCPEGKQLWGAKFLQCRRGDNCNNCNRLTCGEWFWNGVKGENPPTCGGAADICPPINGTTDIENIADDFVHPPTAPGMSIDIKCKEGYVPKYQLQPNNGTTGGRTPDPSNPWKRGYLCSNNRNPISGEFEWDGSTKPQCIPQCSANPSYWKKYPAALQGTVVPSTNNTDDRWRTPGGCPVPLKGSCDNQCNNYAEVGGGQFQTSDKNGKSQRDCGSPNCGLDWDMCNSSPNLTLNFFPLKLFVNYKMDMPFSRNGWLGLYEVDEENPKTNDEFLVARHLSADSYEDNMYIDLDTQLMKHPFNQRRWNPTLQYEVRVFADLSTNHLIGIARLCWNLGRCDTRQLNDQIIGTSTGDSKISTQSIDTNMEAGSITALFSDVTLPHRSPQILMNWEHAEKVRAKHRLFNTQQQQTTTQNNARTDRSQYFQRGCQQTGCSCSKLGDGTCDSICNIPECGYDAGDCYCKWSDLTVPGADAINRQSCNNTLGKGSGSTTDLFGTGSYCIFNCSKDTYAWEVTSTGPIRAHNALRVHCVRDAAGNTRWQQLSCAAGCLHPPVIPTDPNIKVSLDYIPCADQLVERVAGIAHSYSGMGIKLNEYCKQVRCQNGYVRDEQAAWVCSRYTDTTTRRTTYGLLPVNLTTGVLGTTPTRRLDLLAAFCKPPGINPPIQPVVGVLCGTPPRDTSTYKITNSTGRCRRGIAGTSADRNSGGQCEYTCSGNFKPLDGTTNLYCISDGLGGLRWTQPICYESCANGKPIIAGGRDGLYEKCSQQDVGSACSAACVVDKATMSEAGSCAQQLQFKCLPTGIVNNGVGKVGWVGANMSDSTQCMEVCNCNDLKDLGDIACKKTRQDAEGTDLYTNHGRGLENIWCNDKKTNKPYKYDTASGNTQVPYCYDGVWVWIDKNGNPIPRTTQVMCTAPTGPPKPTPPPPDCTRKNLQDWWRSTNDDMNTVAVLRVTSTELHPAMCGTDPWKPGDVAVSQLKCIFKGKRSEPLGSDSIVCLGGSSFGYGKPTEPHTMCRCPPWPLDTADLAMYALQEPLCDWTTPGDYCKKTTQDWSKACPSGYTLVWPKEAQNQYWQYGPYCKAPDQSGKKEYWGTWVNVPKCVPACAGTSEPVFGTPGGCKSQALTSNNVSVVTAGGGSTQEGCDWFCRTWNQKVNQLSSDPNVAFDQSDDSRDCAVPSCWENKIGNRHERCKSPTADVTVLPNSLMAKWIIETRELPRNAWWGMYTLPNAKHHEWTYASHLPKTDGDNIIDNNQYMVERDVQYEHIWNDMTELSLLIATNKTQQWIPSHLELRMFRDLQNADKLEELLLRTASLCPADTCSKTKPPTPTTVILQDTCKTGCSKYQYADGVCDPLCNAQECNWDGGDCGCNKIDDTVVRGLDMSSLSTDCKLPWMAPGTLCKVGCSRPGATLFTTPYKAIDSSTLQPVDSIVCRQQRYNNHGATWEPASCERACSTPPPVPPREQFLTWKTAADNLPCTNVRSRAFCVATCSDGLVPADNIGKAICLDGVWTYQGTERARCLFQCDVQALQTVVTFDRKGNGGPRAPPCNDPSNCPNAWQIQLTPADVKNYQKQQIFGWPTSTPWDPTKKNITGWDCGSSGNLNPELPGTQSRCAPKCAAGESPHGFLTCKNWVVTHKPNGDKDPKMQQYSFDHTTSVGYAWGWDTEPQCVQAPSRPTTGCRLQALIDILTTRYAHSTPICRKPIDNQADSYQVGVICDFRCNPKHTAIPISDATLREKWVRLMTANDTEVTRLVGNMVQAGPNVPDYNLEELTKGAAVCSAGGDWIGVDGNRIIGCYPPCVAEPYVFGGAEGCSGTMVGAICHSWKCDTNWVPSKCNDLRPLCHLDAWVSNSVSYDPANSRWMKSFVPSGNQVALTAADFSRFWNVQRFRNTTLPSCKAPCHANSLLLESIIGCKEGGKWISHGATCTPLCSADLKANQSAAANSRNPLICYDGHLHGTNPCKGYLKAQECSDLSCCCNTVDIKLAPHTSVPAIQAIQADGCSTCVAAGFNATVYCTDAYELKGSTEVRCTKYGIWDFGDAGDPFCVGKQQDYCKPLTNGQLYLAPGAAGQGININNLGATTVCEGVRDGAPCKNFECAPGYTPIWSQQVLSSKPICSMATGTTILTQQLVFGPICQNGYFINIPTCEKACEIASECLQEDEYCCDGVCSADIGAYSCAGPSCCDYNYQKMNSITNFPQFSGAKMRAILEKRTLQQDGKQSLCDPIEGEMFILPTTVRVRFTVNRPLPSTAWIGVFNPQPEMDWNETYSESTQTKFLASNYVWIGNIAEIPSAGMSVWSEDIPLETLGTRPNAMIGPDVEARLFADRAVDSAPIATARLCNCACNGQFPQQQQGDAPTPASTSSILTAESVLVNQKVEETLGLHVAVGAQKGKPECDDEAVAEKFKEYFDANCADNVGTGWQIFAVLMILLFILLLLGTIYLVYQATQTRASQADYGDL